VAVGAPAEESAEGAEALAPSATWPASAAKGAAFFGGGCLDSGILIGEVAPPAPPPPPAPAAASEVFVFVASLGDSSFQGLPIVPTFRFDLSILCGIQKTCIVVL